MKVTIVFDFPEITDPDSQAADDVVEALTSLSTQQEDEFNALPPYKGFGKVAVWVEEVEGASGPLPDLIKFAVAYAAGYYDGRTQGVEYNTYKDDAQRHGYRLGYDSGVADFSIEDEEQRDAERIAESIGK